MPLSKETKTEILKGFIALIVAVSVAILTYYLGRSSGREGKQEGFDKIRTQVNLNGTKWQVSYEESFAPAASTTPELPETNKTSSAKKTTPTPTPAPTPLIKVATVQFKQFGSRIVGTGTDLEGREWVIEGSAADRRVCYIYYDARGSALSFGTVLLEMNGWATEMDGKWVGWSPVSNELLLRSVKLKKL